MNADFSCAINYFGIVPAYTDYYIEVPVNNNGYEPPILLARRTLAPGSTSDSFIVQVHSLPLWNQSVSDSPFSGPWRKLLCKYELYGDIRYDLPRRR